MISYIFDVDKRAFPSSCFKGAFLIIKRGLIIYRGQRVRKRKRRRPRLLTNEIRRMRPVFAKNGRLKLTFADSALIAINLAVKRRNKDLIKRIESVFAARRQKESTDKNTALRY
jgi:hypothetical protein